MRDSICCDTCAFYAYDDVYDYYYCSMNMDEDDYYRVSESKYKICPYWRDNDEYKILRRQ